MARGELDDLIKLQYFSDIGKDIVKERSLRGVLDRLMARIGECFAPLNWSLLLLDQERDELVFKIAVGKASEILVGRRIPAFEGVAGWVASNGRALIVEDASKDPRFSERVDSITGFKTESIIAVPLKTEERTYGVIELVNKLDGGRFSALELRTLATIADFGAIAIERFVYLSRLRRRVETDPLTGLLNRRGLSRVLVRDGRRVKRYGGQIAFILADIDEFKAINDTRGHAAGDAVLRAVASAIEGAARESDEVARYGGDEFLVVLPAAGPNEAEGARHRLAAALQSASASCAVGPFTVTLGIHAGEDSDRDLYRQKGGRRAKDGLEDNIMDMMDEPENCPYTGHFGP
jgi:diguanylate cyclase (GGDEF)-like protein